MTTFSSVELIYFLLPIIGFIIGVFGSMFGGGGGFFILPILILGLGMQAQAAVITSLVASLPICLVGSWRYYKKGNINFKTGGFFATLGIMGAFFGAGISKFINNKQLQTFFGIYSIIMAFNIIYNTWRRNKPKFNNISNQKSTPKFLKISKSALFGFSAGTVTGIFGTSGTAPVLAGLFNLKMPIKMVIGTSLLVVMINTVFAISAHSIQGSINILVVSLLTIGSITGTFIGSRFMNKVKLEKSEGVVKYTYALVIMAIGIIMIKGN